MRYIRNNRVRQNANMIHVPGNESKDVMMMIEAVGLAPLPVYLPWHNLCIAFYYCE